MRTLRLIVSIMAAGTGLLSQCTLPVSTLNIADGPQTDILQPLIVTSFWSPVVMTGTDLTASPVWQFCPPDTVFMTQLTGNGTTFLAIQQGNPTYPTHDVLEEIDETGAMVWSVSVDAANSQLAAMGLPPVLNWNHDATRLPNGWTAVLANNEMLITGGQCSSANTPPLPPGTCDVMGDAVVVVDQTGTIQWFWNAFDWNTPTGLPWTRAAVLGETCGPLSSTAHGSCPITLAPQANDWLHANTLYYDVDGNFIVSLRHQDWVIKIAYEAGYGDGHVVWRLGKQGDFTLINPLGVKSPWFSHQHDAQRQFNGQLSLFDNGNTRHAASSQAKSRGQAWNLDEVGMTATLSANFQLSLYSSAYGSAQLLANGNWWFFAGDVGGTFKSRGIEFTPTGTRVFQISYPNPGYRSFRLSGLFMDRVTER